MSQKIYDPVTEFAEAIEAVESFLAERPMMTLDECFAWIAEETKERDAKRKAFA